MEKKRVTRILSRAASADVKAMSAWLQQKYPAAVLREPMKTLVMMPLCEPVGLTPFYLGELLTSEAMVELAGVRGFGICIGDDFEKSLAMAVIDAAYNAGLPECHWLDERLATLESGQEQRIAREAAIHRDTLVSFHTMEGQ